MMNLMNSLRAFKLYQYSTKFIDRITLISKAGTGGNGSGSFARDNFTPRGKADGGNGGDGGNVYAISDPSFNNLNHIRHEYQAENGVNGGGNGCYGMKGKDNTIPVPLGTIIYKIDSNGKKFIIDECDEPLKKVLISKGGKGGRGNRTLRTNNHQHENGNHGEDLEIELDMNTIADIGLVGLPNAGKSSFLASISRSNPKIAAYPFTTLSPNIGMLEFDNGLSISLADVPGLIEGAHQNVGLGHEFLKHIRKSKKLILVLDLSGSDPVKDAGSIIKELELYQRGLSTKIFLILANKIDRLKREGSNDDYDQEILKRIEKSFPQFKLLPYSAKYKYGIKNVKTFLEANALIN